MAGIGFVKYNIHLYVVTYKVQVFNPTEFPDVPSGSVSEQLVGLGSENFIRIDSTTLITDLETKRFSSESVRSLMPHSAKHIHIYFKIFAF